MELVDQLVEAVLKDSVKEKVVVYGGRFQPFHKGHKKVYDALVSKFGSKNVFIASSDVQDSNKSPLSFKEKKEIATKLFGIPSSKFVKVKNPYQPVEILRDFDEKKTALIVAVGEKDNSRLGGAYFKPYKGDNGMKPYGVEAYVYTSLPSNSFGATDIRNMFRNKRLGDKKKHSEFERFFGKWDQSIYNNLDNKLNEGFPGGIGIGLTLPNGYINGAPSAKKKKKEDDVDEAIRSHSHKADKEGDHNFVHHHKTSMYAPDMGYGAERDTYDFDDGTIEPGYQSNKKDKVDRGYEPANEQNKIPGGLAKGKTLIDLAKKWDPKGYYEPTQFAKEYIKPQLKKGIKVEMEHTTDIKIATEIAMDHLWEDIKYYDKLAKIEKPKEIKEENPLYQPDELDLENILNYEFSDTATGKKYTIKQALKLPKTEFARQEAMRLLRVHLAKNHISGGGNIGKKLFPPNETDDEKQVNLSLYKGYESVDEVSARGSGYDEKILDQMVKNPETGEMVKVRSALNYPKQHAAYQAAIKLVRNANKNVPTRRVGRQKHPVAIKKGTAKLHTQPSAKNKPTQTQQQPTTGKEQPPTQQTQPTPNQQTQQKGAEMKPHKDNNRISVFRGETSGKDIKTLGFEKGGNLYGVEHGDTQMVDDIIKQVQLTIPKEKWKDIVFIGEGGATNDAGDLEFNDEQQYAADKFKQMGASIDSFDGDELDVHNDQSQLYKMQKIATGLSDSKIKAGNWASMIGQGEGIDTMNPKDFLDEEGKKFIEDAITEAGFKKIENWDDPTELDREILYRLSFPEDNGDKETKINDVQIAYNKARDLNLLLKTKKAQKNGKIPVTIAGDSHVDLVASGLKVPGTDIDKEPKLQDVPEDFKKQVSTKINDLQKQFEDDKKNGVKREVYNLCKISVPGTNLYCDGNKNIKREAMPQFKGKPLPNTPAAEMELNKDGEVDTEPMFRKMLDEKGIKVTQEEVPVESLKATQNELVGQKVLGMEGALEENPEHPAITAPIYVSKDGYVVDGHHRWAAVTSYNLKHPEKPIPMKVMIIDDTIDNVIPMANKFAEDIGIAAKSGNDPKKTELKESLLLEGGAYGHMNHPFDIQMNLTFGDLKNIVNGALEGDLGVVREKTDGQALAISWKNGRLIAARNKSHLANAGAGAMDAAQLGAKFGGRGALSDAYSFAVKDLENAIRGLSDKQKEKIFKNGKCFVNLEVIYPENANVIPYGQNLLVFHNVVEYNEAGNAIGKVDGGESVLAGMIKQINAHVQSKYTIQGPPITNLPKTKKLSSQKSKFIGMITKLQKEFGLKDNDGVADYHQAWWDNFISKSKKKIDGVERAGLIKRWAFDDKNFRIANIKDEKAREWAEGIDKGVKTTIMAGNLRKFEDIFLAVGAEVLSFMSSVLTAKPDSALQSMRKSLETTAQQIMSGGTITQIKKLEKELARLNAIGGFEKIVPNEGLVFFYKGNTYKLTGAFAPLNQILGIFKFSR